MNPALPDRPTPGLSIADLEDVYDALAQAIDRAGEGRSELFLVKLALLQAQALGDVAQVRRSIEAALDDL
jgi:hypothetical protein